MASRSSIGPADTELSERHGTLTAGRPANPQRLLGVGDAFIGEKLLAVSTLCSPALCFSFGVMSRRESRVAAQDVRGPPATPLGWLVRFLIGGS